MKIINLLIDERETVQKKTFTKWVNSHLQRTGGRVEDLYVDLRDGKNLLKLLEVLSGETLPRPTRGKMRIHCLENVDKALTFLQECRVHLENLGAHDIVDGSSRLTLGLIWTIILRFQIQEIQVDDYDTAETRQAKDALLLWCQIKTAGYPNVNVRNFTSSWRDGLAFNALIHKHRPDLVQYDKMQKAAPVNNLNNAFQVADDKLGIPKLLDPEDVNVDQPDEKSIMTYVAAYYHYFSKTKAETVNAKRIGKLIGQAIDFDKTAEEYERLTSDLLAWIERKVAELNEREFENSLHGVQLQLQDFTSYRTAEKPPKFAEKGNLEVMLFTLQSQMRANYRQPYKAPEGKMIADINKAWSVLEHAEHERELALREELIRQEKLEQLANRFDRKAAMRESWLLENQRLISNDNFGNDLPSVEAALKKQEAIETDIQAYEERVQAVVQVAEELEKENFHDIDRINQRKDSVLASWRYLMELLRARRSRLLITHDLQNVFQEMSLTHDWIKEMRDEFASEEYGRHLVDVEDLIQKHNLREADLHVLGERVTQVNNNAQRFVDADFPEVPGYVPVEPDAVRARVTALESSYNDLLELAADRKHKLDDSKKMWEFYSEIADEGNWIREKEQLLTSPELGHDLTSVQHLINKHKNIEEDIDSHNLHFVATVQVSIYFFK